MKRIFYSLMMLVVIFSIVGSTVAFAEETVIEGTTSESDSVSENVDTATEVEADPTIFTRLYEAFTTNKTDVFTLGGSAVLLVISLILRKDLGSSSKNIVDGIARMLSKTDLSNEKQDAIVGGLNEMVDGYNDIKKHSAEVKDEMTRFASQITSIKESNISLEKKIDNFFNVIVILMDTGITQNAEVMEVLSSVYANNNLLPKGIKDFVALKRTENAKLVREAALIVHKEEGVANE